MIDKTKCVNYFCEESFIKKHDRLYPQN
jgi:hypothetical protein